MTPKHLKIQRESGFKTLRELTASEIVAEAILVLTARGCKVWKQNNHATRGRRNNVEKGVSDIIGFHRSTGVFVSCEVKTKRDRLSEEQKEMLFQVAEAGGIALVARDNKGFELVNYKDILTDLDKL